MPLTIYRYIVKVVHSSPSRDVNFPLMPESYLVQEIKKKGGPSGFAVFPPPIARRFFWLIGFRCSLLAYTLFIYTLESVICSENCKIIWQLSAECGKLIHKNCKEYCWGPWFMTITSSRKLLLYWVSLNNCAFVCNCLSSAKTLNPLFIIIIIISFMSHLRF